MEPRTPTPALGTLPRGGRGADASGSRTQGRLCPSTWPGGPAPQTAPGPRMPPGTLTPPPPEPCWVFPALVPYAEVLLPPADRLARGPASLAAAQPLPAGPGPPLSAKLPDHVLPRVDHSPQSSQLPPQDGQADLASPQGLAFPALPSSGRCQNHCRLLTGPSSTDLAAPPLSQATPLPGGRSPAPFAAATGALVLSP